jgi:3-oxosteroid 1-dehydrogenase
MTMTPENNESGVYPQDQVDLLIVGSGAGSVVAALLAIDGGLRPLIVEKLDVVGGTTAYSGGVAWIPCNPLMAREGVTDSPERATCYLEKAVWHRGPGNTEEKQRAFLRAGPDMVAYLENKGMKFVRPKCYPDYHSDLTGAEQTSRSISAQLFDLNELGEWKQHFAGTARPALPFSVDEAFRLSLLKRSWASRGLALKVGWRVLADKLRGRDMRGTGAALQGRLLQLALRNQIPIWRNTTVQELVEEEGRVVGARVLRDGKPVMIRAARGVLLNAGGFAKNPAMRERHGRQPVFSQFSQASPGDTGEVMAMAMALGADSDCLDEALWGLGSMEPDGRFPGGNAGPDSNPPPGHHFDISLPHCILVDQNGKRFTNEADSYMTVGQNLYARNEATGGRGIPAFAIIESRHRRNYPWGMTLGRAPKSWYESGYLRKANTLEDLARQCGIDVDGLLATVERFNRHCLNGIDDDYGRGGKAFDNCHGDPTVKPNPNLGSIEKPPFYGVAIYPGDVSTWGGIVTDHHARVLDKSGRVIEGLYATGTTAASLFGRTYPGAGASIGPAMVFGYLAARHVCTQ